jgi:hypothetical protein
MNFAEISFWLKEVDSCIKRRDKELVKRNNYPYLIKYYEGEQAQNLEGSTTRKKLAIINEYFPNVNQLINDMAYQYPEFILEPFKPQAAEGEPIMKGALQFAMKRLDAVSENRVALFDMLFAGFSAVEVNHINKDQSPSIGITGTGKPPEGMVERLKNFISGKAKDEGQAEENLAKATPAKEENYATPDETYLRRWNPLDIILDYRAERVKDLRYIGKIIRMTHAEFSERYPKFKDKVKVDAVLEYSEHELDENKKLVTLYEIQIKENDDVYRSILISPSYKNSEIDTWVRPYVTNSFNIKIGVLDEYGKLYPISRGQINKNNQDDTNNYFTFMMEVAERNIPKIVYDKGRVKQDAIDAVSSTKVNALAGVDGEPSTSFYPLPATKVSAENKELIAAYNQQKEKLWNVSGTRLGGRANQEFATEIAIQEEGFQASRIGIQEGLKKLWLMEADAVKDIIVQYWDKPYWFKVTGSAEPAWYEPEMVPDPVNGGEMVANPLTEILTADYDIDLDMTSMIRPNKERKKRELIEFAKWITSPEVTQFAMGQGYMVNIGVLQKVAKEWGWNPENILKKMEPEEPAEEEPSPPENVTPEQAQADAQFLQEQGIL